MNLNQLRVFYVAARERSHTRAARVLFITQPAVSQNIKALETYLGLPLFSKTGRQRELTPAGRILYDHAERIFTSADEAEQSMRELGAIDRGELRVGTTKIYARYLMPSIIDAYRERHPDITVMLDEGSSEQIVRSVADLTNHLGVVGRVDLPPRMRHLPFRRIQLDSRRGGRSSSRTTDRRGRAGHLEGPDRSASHPAGARAPAAGWRPSSAWPARAWSPAWSWNRGRSTSSSGTSPRGRRWHSCTSPTFATNSKAAAWCGSRLAGGDLELETYIVLLPDVSPHPGGPRLPAGAGGVGHRRLERPAGQRRGHARDTLTPHRCLRTERSNRSTTA